MADSPNDMSAPALSSGTAPLPQLRLHHLFALTAVMAVLLAIQGPQGDASTASVTSQGNRSPDWIVWGFLYQALSAAAITALVYGLVGRRRGVPFFTQPGHWLLLELTIVTLLGIPISIFFRVVDVTTVRMGSWPMSLMVAFSLYGFLSLFVGRVLLNIYFARKCEQSRWKRVFYAKAFSALLFGVADFVALVLAIIAARTDWRDRGSLDGRHWCGVLVQILMSGLTVGYVTIGLLVPVIFA